MEQPQQPTTVAILGGNTVAGKALALLLGSVGYDTRVIEGPPTGRPDEQLEGVDLILIFPGLRVKRRRESLALLRSGKARMSVPVLELSSAIEKGLRSEGVGTVPWPSAIEDVARAINAALTPATTSVSEASTGAAQ
jgi:hypothetical protein